MTPFFTSFRPLLEERLDALLTSGGMPPLQLESMRYSALSGGKRLRGTLVLGLCSLYGADMDAAADLAAAVEMLHAYSLIHDDLPGMDNDVLRRGKPTNHVVYGVGQAILAGDGLLNQACEVLLDRCLRAEDTARLTRCAREIMKGAGTSGMIGGQCLDLESERRGSADMAQLEAIHYGKTACMFIYPVRSALILSGRDDLLEEGTAFAEAFGRLFQATDDILDVLGSEEAVGKSIGKDAAAGKLTYCSLCGVSEAKKICTAFAKEAVRHASRLAPADGELRELIAKVEVRDR